MNQLKIYKALILGVSFGGGLAMEFAATYPEMVEGLILNSPPLFYGEKITPFQRFEFNFIRSVSWLKTLIYNLIVRSWRFGLFFFFGETSPGDSKTLLLFQNIKHVKMNALEQVLSLIIDVDLRPAVKKISAPAFIFVGSKEKLFLNEAKYIHEHVENSCLEIVDGEKHSFLVDNPEGYVKIVEKGVDFINKKMPS